MKDKSGRAYLTTDRARAGMFVEFDGDFDCLLSGRKYEVQINEGKELYVWCSRGRHYLDGQRSGDHYVGVYPTTES